jgi:rhodanese-related sulfurtransferase
VRIGLVPVLRRKQANRRNRRKAAATRHRVIAPRPSIPQGSVRRAPEMVHSPRFLQIVEDAKTRIQEVTVDDVKRSGDKGEDFLLVDTREDSEWAAGHAAGSIHLGKGVIERDIEQQVPDNSKKLVLYCGGGFRSALAADALQKMGYTNVYSLAGGWRAWNQAQMPVESGEDL